jgi:hypothetical protein
VAVRFAPHQARWIRERKWHRSARIQEELDGSLVLRLRVVESSELRRWVLQFGSQAEVLAPASLRKAVAAELKAAAAAYRLSPRGNANERCGGERSRAGFRMQMIDGRPSSPRRTWSALSRASTSLPWSWPPLPAW